MAIGLDSCQSVYFMIIWYIFPVLKDFFLLLVRCTNKNLATLVDICGSPHHVRVQHFADLDEGLAVVAALVGRVDVLDHLAEVVRHALKLEPILEISFRRD
jgi:hypothetical protein